MNAEYAMREVTCEECENLVKLKNSSSPKVT